MERLKLQRINKELVDKCVDLYIETFSKEPWNDVYESREQVVKLFNNHLNNNYFVCKCPKMTYNGYKNRGNC